MRASSMLMVCGALLLSMEAAHACKCAVRPASEVAQSLRYVFSARVSAVRVEEGSLVARVERVRKIKGASPATMEVHTRDSTAACGWPFKVGERVTVGVTVVDGRYHASACAMHSLNQGWR